jgi:predicted nuclease with TOPRIM domain
MKQTDMNQLLDMVTEQRNSAEAERNALNAKLTDKISDIIFLRARVEELEQENSDLRDSLQIALYGISEMCDMAWDECKKMNMEIK